MARYLIEVPDDSPFFTTTNEFDGSPEPITIVAFTRGDSIGTDLIADLQAASDEGYISGDFQLAKVCTSDDPNCPIHEA